MEKLSHRLFISNRVKLIMNEKNSLFFIIALLVGLAPVNNAAEPINNRPSTSNQSTSGNNNVRRISDGHQSAQAKPVTTSKWHSFKRFVAKNSKQLCYVVGGLGALACIAAFYRPRGNTPSEEFPLTEDQRERQRNMDIHAEQRRRAEQLPLTEKHRLAEGYAEALLQDIEREAYSDAESDRQQRLLEADLRNIDALHKATICRIMAEYNEEIRRIRAKLPAARQNSTCWIYRFRFS